MEPDNRVDNKPEAEHADELPLLWPEHPSQDQPPLPIEVEDWLDLSGGGRRSGEKPASAAKAAEEEVPLVPLAPEEDAPVTPIVATLADNWVQEPSRAQQLAAAEEDDGQPYRLRDPEPDDASMPAGATATLPSLPPKDRVLAEDVARARPLDSARSRSSLKGPAGAGGSTSVFKPVGTAASQPISLPVPARVVRAAQAKVREKSPASVFEPAHGSRSSPATGEEAGAPSRASPAKEPGRAASAAVSPLYRRGLEYRSVFLTAAVVLALGVVLIVAPLSWLVGVVLFSGGLLLTLYRIALVLDPPVRVTPEQGIREFYEALCHHLPNYRRMYLLLSVAGKQAPEFGSFGAFRSYWRWRHRQLVRKDFSWKPLAFRLEGFETQYNADRTFAQVRFSLCLFVRGQSKIPLLTRNIATTLVKARDGSWHLNDGTLPES